MRKLAFTLLAQEAVALQRRLSRVKPFIMTETMVPAASIPFVAQRAVDQYLLQGRKDLHQQINKYLKWLKQAFDENISVHSAQRRFTFLRLKFNAVLAQLDIYSDALSQRSESQTGIWLSGLDALADDALKLNSNLYNPPSIICYLERGAGAAIRRVNTRLPGGGNNPTAIIRIPRERMIGSGIASSLVHEVGHQGIALLDLINSMRNELQNLQKVNSDDKQAWLIWESWISEIMADFWSISRIGIGSTLGLMGVLSLPSAFVFRTKNNDPHPFPWIRVMLSCAIGRALYPDAQWSALESVWMKMYPAKDININTQKKIKLLMSTRDALASVLMNHRSNKLQNKTLSEHLNIKQRTPIRLRSIWSNSQKNIKIMNQLSPVMAFAVIGQAKMDRRITAEEEDKMINSLLRKWAYERAININQICSRSKPTKAMHIINLNTRKVGV